MFLSDNSIKNALANGKIKIVPYNDLYLRPCSISLTLGTEIVKLQWPNKIDIRNQRTYPKAKETWNLLHSDYELKLGDFVLASTKEKISLDTNIAGIIFNISGLARLGLEIGPPSLISPGYGSANLSTITLEILNKGGSTISLVHGMRICHIAFIVLDTTAIRNYDSDVGVYSNQIGPKLSAFFKNWK